MNSPHGHDPLTDEDAPETGLGECEVTLTISLADAESPEEVARRFLSVVRHAPHHGTDLVVDVHVNATGETIAVTVPAGQQID